MKNVLLFAAIMIVCGSLKKDDRVRCPEKVRVKLYLDGRIVGKDYILYMKRSIPSATTLSNGKTVYCDSLVYSLSY